MPTEPVILHADDQLVVADKPSGLLVHCSAWAGDDGVALANLVGRRLGRPVHPVHRLDRATSGVVVFALSPEAARGVQAQFEAGTVDKRYLALVRGAPPESADVDHPVPKREGGARAPARTLLRCLATVTVADSPLREKRYALVEAVPRTGRFHQVRRHLKHLGHPVLGDANYGRAEHNRLVLDRFGLRRLALHAAEITLVHPATGERLQVASPLPEDLRVPLERMGFVLSGASGTPLPPGEGQG